MRGRLPSGPLHWEPAEFSSQQTVGCSGGLPARLCQHADEAVAGNKKPKKDFWDKYNNHSKFWGH